MSVLNPAVRPAARQYLAAVRALLVLTVLLGLAYPLLLTGVGAVAFRHEADGSMLTMQGRPVGSTLIGQSFTDAKGDPLPQWFQSRPSAAGDGYDGAASSASNLGPDNPALVVDVEQRRAQVAAFNGVAPSAVPADAVTASASGLDPDISPAYARLQIARVAKARSLPTAAVTRLVTRAEHGRTLGFLGEPVVNVVDLNAALARLAG